MTDESQKSAAGFSFWGDFQAAAMFLTRLPGLDGARPLAGAMWAFPLVGVLVGLTGGVAFATALHLGLNSWFAAFLALTATAMTTGALHEDGLSDAADGLWGGHTIEKRLEIMRDSRLGGYGALALVLATGLKASALSGITDGATALSLLIAAHAGSRAVMPMAMAALQPAGSGGLAAAVGRPSRRIGWWALGLGAAVVILALAPHMGVTAIVAGVVAALLALMLVRAKLAATTVTRWG